ncbi:hypothetical protein SDJN02_08993, partial [Cucurbita argyrosperma subsp. argyrosperma]
MKRRSINRDAVKWLAGGIITNVSSAADRFINNKFSATDLNLLTFASSRTRRDRSPAAIFYLLDTSTSSAGTRYDLDFVPRFL